MKKIRKQQMEKIAVDRRIVESLREGKSVTMLTKWTQKGKGYIIKTRDLALEYGYIAETGVGTRIYQAGSRAMPPYPEALFPLKDGRSEKLSETDEFLKAHLPWIKERLELRWSPQTIFEELPVAIPRSNFYRYLHRQSLMVNVSFRNTMELIHAPGECLQVDWGKLFDVIDSQTGKKKTIWIFIGVMGHSRYEMARVVERLDYKTTIEILISMFEELGGVPRKVTTDNPKVFVIESSKYEPILNAGFARLASSYGFTIEALPPYDPKKKGKVERMVPMKRRLFESYNTESYSLENAQEHMDRKLKIANERKHGTHQGKPIEVFINTEAATLKALPKIRYEIETITYATIRRDGYVPFETKYYRVDICLKGEDALIIANRTQVALYCKGKLLEIYGRITEQFKSKSCKDHYKEPWEKTLQDHGHYLNQARAIGGNAERFVEIVLARGDGFVDTRVIWGLFSLTKKYSNEDIDKACLSALELSQANLSSVKQLLTIMAKPKTKPMANNENQYEQVKGGRFVRSIHEYKIHLKLIQGGKDKGEI